MFLQFVPSWLNKAIQYTLYVFFAMFPFFIFKNFLYQGSSSRFLMITITTAVLIILTGLALFKRKIQISIIKSPIIISFLVYFLYLLISALIGESFHTSFWSKIERTSAIFFLLHLAVFTLLLIHIFEKEKIRDRILKVIVYSSAVYSFLSALGPQGFKIAFKNVPYDGFLFGNSTFAAMYLFGAFLLAVYFLFRTTERKKWFQFLVPLLIFFNPFFINFKIFSGEWHGVASVLGIAQASSVGIFAAILMLFAFGAISFVKKEKLKRNLRVALVSMSVIVVAWVSYSLLNPNGYIRKIYETQSSFARPVVWEISRNSIKEKPLTGWGIDNFTLAFQNNFDNRLLEQEYGEPWFDRAHNIILDQTVDAGYLGISFYVLLYLVIIFFLVLSLLRSQNKNDEMLSTVLITYFIIHFLELQTAFDTVASYITLSVMVALSVWVIYRSKKDLTFFAVNEKIKYVCALVAVSFFSWALFFGSIPFWKMQVANGQMRKAGTSEKRIPYYDEIFKTKVDIAGVLWRISNDFQKGISENPSIVENPERAKKLLEELNIFTAEYEKYVMENPNNFRMKLNLADLYIYHLLFEVDMLDKADALLDDAISLVPNHPQPYVMKAVTHVYRNDFKNARIYAEKAAGINPDSLQVINVKKYIEESEKTFPVIGLFFFSQI